MLELPLYLAVVLFARVLAALPVRVALRLARGLGWILYRIVRIRGRVVRGNLEYVLGDRVDRRDLRAIEREAYQHVCMYAVELLRYSVAPPGRWPVPMDATAIEDLLARFKAGKPFILCSAHLGNFDMLGFAIAAAGIEIHAVMKEVKSKRFHGLLAGARERSGMRVLMKGIEATGELRRLLESGKPIGLLPDQNARSHGVIVQFLGKPASTFRGPAVLHLLTRAPIGVACVTRRKDDPSRHDLEIRWLPELNRTGRRTDEIINVTQQICDAMSEQISRNPGQYFWFHRRWGKESLPSTGQEARAAAAESSNEDTGSRGAR